MIVNSKFEIRNSKLGFTLIELLVVIAIIGILATLVIANMAGVRERARDAQRKSDISQIQKAFELYKNAQSLVSYPPTASWGSALETGGFMKTTPHDPSVASGWPEYSYTRDPAGSDDNLTYRLIACLENASDPQKDSALASYCSGKPASFTRNEP